MNKKIFNLIKDDSIWFMFCSEQSDKYFGKFVSNMTTAPAISIINNKDCFVFVHELDSENIKDNDIKKITYYNNKDLYKNIENVINQMGFPKNIYLNYSTQNDVKIDVLGYGIYNYITDLLSSIYNENGKECVFESAEDYIYALMQQNSKEEIQASKYAAERALDILEEAFNKIKVGMSEKDISSLVHSIFDKKPDYFKKIGVIKEEYSWEKDNCPIVLVGENLTSGGHSMPSNKILEKGNTVYFDFGVKLTFDNGIVASSDIQRTGYALKEGEMIPPEEIQKPFDVLIEAVNLGIKEIMPNVEGYKIDETVRRTYTKVWLSRL